MLQDDAGLATLIALDRRLAMPLYRQIHARVRAAILAGRLGEGARLPSWNALAAGLGVARGTVKAAYEWLAAEGLIEGRGAAGTRVGGGLAGRSPKPSPAPLPQPAALPDPAFGVAPPPFQMGLPALDAFPRTLWARLAARQARRLTPGMLTYQHPAGDARLRQAIAAYLAVARGVACDPDAVLITAGYTGALGLITRALLAPGEAAWLEDPGFPRAREALALAGARIVPVPVDAEGMIVPAGVAAAPGARLAVVTPSHQAPLGMALSLPRRVALLAWAARQNAWIVEDDYLSEFRFDGPPLPALASLDEAGRTIYVGSFSKTLAPSLKLGYVAAPPALVGRLRAFVSYLAPGPPPPVQAALADLLTEGHFARHIRRMRRLYAERRAALAAALGKACAGQMQLALTARGMHLIGLLPPGVDDAALADRAARAGLAPAALSPWFLAAPPTAGLLLGFTNIAADAAQDVAGRLATVLDHTTLRLAARSGIGP